MGTVGKPEGFEGDIVMGLSSAYSPPRSLSLKQITGQIPPFSRGLPFFFGWDGEPAYQFGKLKIISERLSLAGARCYAWHSQKQKVASLE